MRHPLLAALVLSATAALTVSTAAQAAVAGSVSDSNGTAGYYTRPSGIQFDRADATFTVNKPALQYLSNSLAAGDGFIGTQLCDSTTGYTVQAGVVPSPAVPGTWDVVVTRGRYLRNPAGPGLRCEGNVLLIAHVRRTALGQLPAGSTVRVQIMEVYRHHHYELVSTVSDSPLATFTSYQRYFAVRFNETGDGVIGDRNLLSAPAVNDLADFSAVTATTAGQNPRTRGLAYWHAVSVSSGVPGYAPLITPGPLSPASYSCVWHCGHWVRWTTRRGTRVIRHRRWVRGYRSCRGGGPSAFSLVTASPIGFGPRHGPLPLSQP